MDERLFDQAFLAKLERLSLSFPVAANNGYSGARKSNLHGSTVEFSDFREYTAGDDFRRIDWNAYARFERFFVKLYQDEKQMHVRIFLDTSRSMHWGLPDKSIAARRLAAAFAYLGVCALDRVSLVSLTSKAVDLCPVLTGRTSFYQALDILENWPFEGESHLLEAIRTYRPLTRENGVSIVLSDFLTHSEDKAMIDYLLYHKQQVLVVHLLSPDELHPEYLGRMRLLDCETSQYKDLELDSWALEAYRKTLEEFLQEWQSYCSQRGVFYVQWCSEDPWESVLLEKGESLGFIRGRR